MCTVKSVLGEGARDAILMPVDAMDAVSSMCKFTSVN